MSADVVLTPGEWTPQQAATHVSEAWQNAVESIVETGRRLIDAKQRVGHGWWLDTVALLPFSKSTAAALMQIATHPAAECAALDHPPATGNAVSWVGGRTFCLCGQVSQPGMHGGASGLGYQLPSPVSAQQWVFGADGHLDWPHGAAVP